ncbi:hypothetical protein AC249_AIPGENE2071 [Exaiptasia diaphana]|nr:hypothetical protein AC249_AIPGENE2071 [Exaiptasia diaphana]
MDKAANVFARCVTAIVGILGVMAIIAMVGEEGVNAEQATLQKNVEKLVHFAENEIKVRYIVIQYDLLGSRSLDR